MPLHENVLHYIWNFRLFNHQNLKTDDGLAIEIIEKGFLNTNAGPDFYNAKIKIADTVWAGNVEIHIHSSDWLKHKHQLDKAYENVILHVVWINDGEIKRADGTLIPTLSLAKLVDKKLIFDINQLTESKNWIPCERQIAEVNDFTVQQWLNRMLIERLEEKSVYFEELNKNLKGSWEDTFYLGLAKSFGFKINSLPFEILARSLPQQLLAKHKNSALQIDALIFGVAGLLNKDFKDDYPQKLQKEFSFLKSKYQLQTIDTHLWKFAKTRPDNFPTIRLAQFSALIFRSCHLFSKIIDTENIKDLMALFSNLSVNEYWNQHYRFDVRHEKTNVKNIGAGSVSILLINTVAPLVFCYRKQIGKENYADDASNLLFAIKPENNQIIQKFSELGLKAKSAFDSQALLQLKNLYCNQKKCLNCGIGIKILKV